ncbi:MAG: hypothetical protein ACR2N5_00670 [Solirubrobacterales bacterium]
MPGTTPENIVSDETDVCIEGFPRSGNTFANAYFRHFNPDLRVGHHIHLPGQLLRAIRFGTPRVMLVRHPRQATLSALVAGGGVVGPDLILRSYISFYRRLLPVLDEIPVCPFDEVIGDPAAMVERLNERFDASFRYARLSAADSAALRAEMEGWARTGGYPPELQAITTAEKEKMKARWTEAVAEQPLLTTAADIHDEVLAGAA